MITFPEHPNYIVILEIGKGAYGSVFKVKDTNDNNKIYAIKKMEITNDDKIKEMENEVEILSSFNSEYIVKYFDSFYDNDYFYIVMEYCGDSNLAKFIDKHKNKNDLIDENIIFSIINSISLGLKEIHNKDIIHRDLNPNNIFMGKNFEIKIGDFGISKKLNHQVYANSNVGCYMYMAPEISQNKTKYNKKVDIWSLGCICYELLTLNKYYNDVIIQEIINEKHQEIILDDKYNKCWVELLKSLLKKKYNERPDIDEVRDLVKECGQKLNSISTSASSSSLINIFYNHYYIKFKGDIEEDEIFLNFPSCIALKEMFEILLKRNYSINTIDIEKYTFLYNSRIINKQNYLNKPLYKIFGIHQNITIKIFENGKMLG